MSCFEIELKWIREQVLSCWIGDSFVFQLNDLEKEVAHSFDDRSIKHEAHCKGKAERKNWWKGEMEEKLERLSDWEGKRKS